jgi:hypothetical protein
MSWARLQRDSTESQGAGVGRVSLTLHLDLEAAGQRPPGTIRQPLRSHWSKVNVEAVAVPATFAVPVHTVPLAACPENLN